MSTVYGLPSPELVEAAERGEVMLGGCVMFEGPKSVKEAHSSAELLELVTGTATDAPLCMTCGTKMRPAGSCYVCEGCGSTSGCS